MPVRADRTAGSTEMERMERDMERRAQQQVLDFSDMERMERMERDVYACARAGASCSGLPHTHPTLARVYVAFHAFHAFHA